jgi:hypothetical protein
LAAFRMALPGPKTLQTPIVERLARAGDCTLALGVRAVTL